MDEKLLKKRLRRLTVAVILISIVVLILGSYASYYLRTILGEALSEKMKSETEQYKIAIQRQMNADLQTLNTLASFLRYTNLSPDVFADAFLNSKEYNNFEGMAFYGKEGVDINIRINSDCDIDQITSVDTLNEAVRTAVEKAWCGSSAVSEIFCDQKTNADMFAYAVPVRAGDRLAGAMVATVKTEELTVLLDDNRLLGNQGYIHLISDSGNILIRSENTIISEDVDSVFDNPNITLSNEKEVRQAISEGRECISQFTYKNQNYQMFFDPIGVNGWCLLRVQTAQGVSSTIFRLMTNTRIITVVFLFAIMIVIALGYRIICRGNRRLIESVCYDPLTGAYNLSKFIYEIGPIIENSKEYSLAALNVRQFKFINELFGSREADLLLCCIRKVLSENITDNEYYCRSSEDLFYILLRDTDRRVVACRIQDIISKISQYGFGGHRDYQIRLYCGVMTGTEVPDPDPDVQKSMTHVRFALKTARTSLKNYIWFYDTELHRTEVLENFVESHMNQALENQEFKMYLQPKIDLKSGIVAGAEALVRWVPETGDMLYPGQFIPLFENNGFCSNLDLYMVEQVCRQIRDWKNQGTEPVPLSVNQSKLVFYEADYIERMKALLDQYGVEGNLITLEILEGLAMRNTDELNDKIHRLKELGFRISMDDFGSGYSSLNTLASLKIDEVKFDRGFLLCMNDLHTNCRRQVTVMEGTVKMAKELGIKTVIEGVETQENERLIQLLGCELGQGYYYSRPVSVKDFSEKYLNCKG